MSTVYVVWGYTDNDTDNDSEVLGIFSNLYLAQARMNERDGSEAWESQAITAYNLNESRDPGTEEIGKFIARVECKDLPLAALKESEP